MHRLKDFDTTNLILYNIFAYFVVFLVYREILCYLVRTGRKNFSQRFQKCIIST